MNMIVTTTALARPDIYQKTLTSFYNNLKGISLKNCDLIINIDPVPGEPLNEKLSHQMVVLARGYFRTVTFSEGVGNFATALKTVWSKVDSTKYDYVFHLEDDWVLKEPININDMIGCMETHDWQCCLRAYNYQTTKGYRYMFCLTPSLIKSGAVSLFARKVLGHENPEETIRKHTKVKNYAHNNKYVAVYPPDRIVLEDIGTAWRDERKLMRDRTDGNWVIYTPG